MRDRLPDARVALIRGLGHLAHEEAPERVAEVLRAEARGRRHACERIRAERAAAGLAPALPGS